MIDPKDRLAAHRQVEAEQIRDLGMDLYNILYRIQKVAHYLPGKEEDFPGLVERSRQFRIGRAAELVRKAAGELQAAADDVPLEDEPEPS